MIRQVNNAILEIIDGDLTEMDVDAIINAANSYLKHGGGVAGAIVRKGGHVIQEESERLGHCMVGQAVITGAGKLKARYVIHTVGPRMGEGNEDEKLRNATINSLKLADTKALQSIAFPAISAGIFGFPIERCAKIMLETTINYLNGKTGLTRVVFCLFGQDSFNVFAKELQEQLPE